MKKKEDEKCRRITKRERGRNKHRLNFYKEQMNKTDEDKNKTKTE